MDRIHHGTLWNLKPAVSLRQLFSIHPDYKHYWPRLLSIIASKRFWFDCLNLESNKNSPCSDENYGIVTALVLSSWIALYLLPAGGTTEDATLDPPAYSSFLLLSFLANLTAERFSLALYRFTFQAFYLRSFGWLSGHPGFQCNRDTFNHFT